MFASRRDEGKYILALALGNHPAEQVVLKAQLLHLRNQHQDAEDGGQGSGELPVEREEDKRRQHQQAAQQMGMENGYGAGEGLPGGL